jgi:lysosomal acid lipase/cholesteryl ester hydrolase
MKYKLTLILLSFIACCTLVFFLRFKKKKLDLHLDDLFAFNSTEFLDSLKENIHSFKEMALNQSEFLSSINNYFNYFNEYNNHDNLSDYLYFNREMTAQKEYLNQYFLNKTIKIQDFFKTHVHKQDFKPMELILKRLGYPIEIHYIQTYDGYILKAFRIQCKNCKKITPLKEVIYMQHGLIDSSDTFTGNTEDKSPGLIFANKGFDVWMVNMRGNKHSRAHVKLNPDVDRKFWDFTWQDMIDYDFPAIVQYIHFKTKAKINYFGHSQGGTIIVGAMALHLKELKLLKNIFAIGPTIFMRNLDTPLFGILAKSDIHKILKFFKIQEIFDANPLLNPTTAFMCGMLSNLCNEIISFASELDSDLVNMDRLSVWLGHYPSGTSVKNILHYRQMLLEKEYILRRYDYGSDTDNKGKYKLPTPPIFDLRKINTTFYLYGGMQDRMASIKDTQEAVRQIGKAVIYKEVEAGHLSFLLGKQMDYVNEIINIIMKNKN